MLSPDNPSTTFHPFVVHIPLHPITGQWTLQPQSTSYHLYAVKLTVGKPQLTDLLGVQDLSFHPLHSLLIEYRVCCDGARESTGLRGLTASLAARLCSDSCKAADLDMAQRRHRSNGWPAYEKLTVG